MFHLIVGPFIVMISHMVGNVLKFVILYTEFYIPYGKVYVIQLTASCFNNITHLLLSTFVVQQKCTMLCDLYRINMTVCII